MVGKIKHGLTAYVTRISSAKIERKKKTFSASHQRTSVRAQCALGFPQQYFPATTVGSDATSHNAMLGQIFHGNCLCFSLRNNQPIMVDLLFLCLCLVCPLPLFRHSDINCKYSSWFHSVICGFCSACVFVGSLPSSKNSRIVCKRVQMVVCLNTWP